MDDLGTNMEVPEIITLDTEAITQRLDAISRDLEAKTRDMEAKTRVTEAMTRDVEAITRATKALTRATEALTQAKEARTRDIVARIGMDILDTSEQVVGASEDNSVAIVEVAGASGLDPGAEEHIRARLDDIKRMMNEMSEFMNEMTVRIGERSVQIEKLIIVIFGVLETRIKEIHGVMKEIRVISPCPEETEKFAESFQILRNSLEDTLDIEDPGASVDVSRARMRESPARREDSKARDLDPVVVNYLKARIELETLMINKVSVYMNNKLNMLTTDTVVRTQIIVMLTAHALGYIRVMMTNGRRLIDCPESSLDNPES